MTKNITILFLTAIVGLLPLVRVEAQINAQQKQAVLEATDDAILIETIQKPGEEPDDIFIKMLACKRLGVYGTDKAVPALAAMLPNEKLNHAARYALETMPCEAANEALIKAAKELDGVCGIGCVDSVGAKRLVQASDMLKEKLKGCDCPMMRKAIYVAFGYFGNDEATAFLQSLLKGEPDKDPVAWRALADALFDCAEVYQAAGNYDKAIEIYDSVVVPSFPVFVQKAASYHALLARKAKVVDLLISKMDSPKACCFTGGLKTIREYAAEDAEPIVKALIAKLDTLPADRQALVLRALGDRKDSVSQALVFPALKKFVASKELGVQIAAIQAMSKVDEKNAVEAFKAITESAEPEDAAQKEIGLAEIVKTVAALPGTDVDDQIIEQYNTLALKEAPVAVAFFKIVELRRIADLGKALVEVANTENVDEAVRTAALYALADIVTLDKLNLLVDALASEKDDNKASWILRSACTRLPREECAAKVISLLDGAKDVEEQGKMLNLLKQIGGKTAIAAVEKACWNPVTVDAASQVLGTWNTPDDIQEVADACLKLAKEAKERKYAVRGIRSYIRIPRQFDMPAAQKFAMCKTAFETASRNEDKVLIFEVFKRVIEVSSAKEAFSYASDAQFAEPAYDAVVAVAKKFQGQSSEIRDMLKTIVANSKTAQTVQDAKAQLDRFDVAEKEAPVMILSAFYGADKQGQDVTGTVKAKFTGKRVINIGGYNETFGDTVPGVKKTLTIQVQMKASGEKRTIVFEENAPVILPEK